MLMNAHRGVYGSHVCVWPHVAPKNKKKHAFTVTLKSFIPLFNHFSLLFHLGLLVLFPFLPSLSVVKSWYLINKLTELDWQRQYFTSLVRLVSPFFTSFFFCICLHLGASCCSSCNCLLLVFHTVWHQQTQCGLHNRRTVELNYSSASIESWTARKSGRE